GFLFCGAKLVIDGSLSVGELVAFNMLAGRVSTPVLRLAQIWQDFHQARLSVARLGDILNTPAEPTFNPGRAALPAIRGDITFEHVTFRYRIDGPEVLHDVSFSVRPVRSLASSAPRAPARARSPSLPSGSTYRRVGAWWWRASTLPPSTPPGCVGNWASCCKKMCCSTARYATTFRSRTLPCRWSRSLRQRRSPEHMSSSWGCQKAMTPSSGSAAPVYRGVRNSG